ncbi:hypothetical protein B0H14DRAFT_3451426 [Mycena olivaceomarginata]|nr:hypothetical protein B0H14DRAFT_3451426 [Mycena olivaceomarginata]
MPFPQIFDAYVPRITVAFLALSKIQPDYVPSHSARSRSTPWLQRLSPTPKDLPLQRFPLRNARRDIAFDELALRVYHTCLLHDLGLTNTSAVLAHPAHAMTFELHGAFMAYGHLHAVAPTYDVARVGDIVQSIVLDTSSWVVGNSSAAGQLMSLTAFFDAETGRGRLQSIIQPHDRGGN